jgi:hypothetical protein
VARGLEGIVRNASIHAAAVGHRRDAADRRRPAAARPTPRATTATGTARREGLQPRSPVLDEAGRGARPAEDGLPRACATSTSSRTRWTSSSARAASART